MAKSRSEVELGREAQSRIETELGREAQSGSKAKATLV
jgi:hypothetical protein